MWIYVCVAGVEYQKVHLTLLLPCHHPPSLVTNLSCINVTAHWTNLQTPAASWDQLKPFDLIPHTSCCSPLLRSTSQPIFPLKIDLSQNRVSLFWKIDVNLPLVPPTPLQSQGSFQWLLLCQIQRWFKSSWSRKELTQFACPLLQWYLPVNSRRPTAMAFHSWLS